MIDQKLFSRDYIKDNIFNLSEDQNDEQSDLILQDAKMAFRLNQIENEGNDPIQTGKSYGTPHDLAALYGSDRSYTNNDGVPVGYDEDKPVMGRPKDGQSRLDKQDSNFGRDRLGNDDNTKKVNFDVKPNYKGNSPLALEGSKQSFLVNRNIFENLEKKVLSVTKSSGEDLLDESQIKE